MTQTTEPSAHAAEAHSRKTVRLTTAQALVRYLQVQHSERDGNVQRAIPGIFGIFGHGNVLGLGQAIGQDGAELPLYQPKNEQAMVHTAIGYAKASRRLATLACTGSIGPGATNMITGAATATVNRLPVLLLPGDTFANRRQGPVLQQLEHPSDADLTVNDAFRPVSRFFDRIARPEQLLTALPQAMRVLLDPAETGAVTIALHQDVQAEAFDFPTEFFNPRIWPITRRPPARDEIKRAATLLKTASRPLLIAGGGVRYSDAEAELRRFAADLSIPVAETSAGKGSLANSPWLLGGLGVNGSRAANEIARDADVIVCIGTRLTDFTTGSHSLFQNEQVAFIGINVNAADAVKLTATAVVADAREALAAVRHEIGNVTRDSYEQEIAERKEGWEAELRAAITPQVGKPMRPGEVLSTLNDHIQATDWVVAAAGYQPGDLLKLWDTPVGSQTHIEFGFSCMAHEIPAGLGIRLRQGRAGEVIVVIGDGTYLMNPTELLTATQEQLKLTVVLLDNGGYQSINHMALGKTGASAGNEFLSRRPGERILTGERLRMDFVANAQSMGCDALSVTTTEELSAALESARAGANTTVIVCRTDSQGALPSSGAFWDLGVPQVASDEAAEELAHAHIEIAKTSQRYY